MPSTLATECSATTAHGRPVTLPEGAEVATTGAEFRRWLALNPNAQSIRVDCRCPEAMKPAPYDIDVSDLLLALLAA